MTESSSRFRPEMLALIGVSVPESVLEIPSLLAIAHKVDSCIPFVPTSKSGPSTVPAGESYDASDTSWADEALELGGPSVRAVVHHAIDAYASTHPASDRS